MSNFKKIAKKLGLEDLEKDFVGDKECKDCGWKLRLGMGQNRYGYSYCPKCKKIISTVSIPRFSKSIKLLPHND